MWKFVTRRFKDTVERTYNVLDVRQTWTCGVHTKDTTKSSEFSSVSTKCDGDFHIWRCVDSKHNERKSSQHDFHDDFNASWKRNSSLLNNAFVTTATLLSGFYLSQVISKVQRRRRLRYLDAKHNLHLFDDSVRTNQTIVGKDFCLLHWALKVYENNVAASDKRHNSYVPSDKRQNKFVFNDGNSEILYRPVPINNDHTKGEADGNSDANDVHVTEAIDGLMKTLGNIEFQLGLKNIQANEHKVAVSHFKQATSHRHAGATFNLGVCYELGIGIKKNMKSAMECYRAAAALGHKKAMYNLGVFYARGEGGLTKNRKAAAACLLAADKLGLQSGRTVLDIPKDMRKPDDEICFKKANMVIEDINAMQQRSAVFE